MVAEGPRHLPAPSSNLLLEISFCRLLASCEEIAAGQDKGREDLRQWQTSPTYHHVSTPYNAPFAFENQTILIVITTSTVDLFLLILFQQYIETLQEQLADLEDSGRIHPTTLETYRKRIGSLSSSLRRAEVSDLCRLLAPLQSTAAAAATVGAPSTAPNAAPAPDTHTHIRPTLPVAAVTVPKPGPTTTKEGKTAIATLPALKPIALSDTAKSKLNTQGRVQEFLTDELADLAAAMKSNTLAMEAKVKERGTLLDGTEAALDKSGAETKIAASRATVAHRRGRRNFCFTFLVLFIIGTAFVGMYLFIRITSITGYKAAKMARTAATITPPPPSSSQPFDDHLETHSEL